MTLDPRSHLRPTPGRRTTADPGAQAVGTRSRGLRLSALVLAVVAGFAMVGGTLSAAHAAMLFKYKTYKVPTANSEPSFVTVGSDGNLWFTEGAEFFTPNPDPDTGGTFHSNIARITPSGRITEFRVNGGGFPHDIVQGPNEVLYFSNNNGLGRISTDGVVAPFIEAPFSVGGQELDAHAGNIWITDFNARSLWRYDIASGGFTEFHIGDGSLFGPSGLVVDGSGSVWFGADSDVGGVVGRLDPAVTDNPDTTARENVTTFSVDGNPNGLTIATDGKVWFTDRFNDTVGFLDPVNNNQVRQFPTLTPEAGPQQIAAAADGSVWFTQANIGNAARITPDGVITEAGKAVGDDPNSGLENALGIAVLPDPDGPAGPQGESVWFTMQAANKIAALR
jgi:streptogramin lyase